MEAKLVSRIKTIAVPYVFWNWFFIEIYALLGWVQRHGWGIFTHEKYFPSGMKEIVRFIWLGYRNPPLWYLQVLIQFILITPALFVLFRKCKTLSLLSLILVLLINIVFYGDVKYASIIYWMPAYGGGIWCGIYCPSFVLENKTKVNRDLAGCIILAAFICILYFEAEKPYINYFKYCGWMIMPFILLKVSNILPQKELYEGMFEVQYLIFCMHYPLIQIFDALIDNFFIPASNGQILFKWFLVVILTLLVIHIFHFLITRFVRPVYRFLYGKY